MTSLRGQTIQRSLTARPMMTCHVLATFSDACIAYLFGCVASLFIFLSLRFCFLSHVTDQGPPSAHKGNGLKWPSYGRGPMCGCGQDDVKRVSIATCRTGRSWDDMVNMSEEDFRNSLHKGSGTKALAQRLWHNGSGTKALAQRLWHKA